MGENYRTTRKRKTQQVEWSLAGRYLGGKMVRRPNLTESWGLGYGARPEWTGGQEPAWEEEEDTANRLATGGPRSGQDRRNGAAAQWVWGRDSDARPDRKVLGSLLPAVKSARVANGGNRLQHGREAGELTTTAPSN
jgi:hypothetical protein